MLEEVRTGTSGSRRLHPREFMESRNVVEAMPGTLLGRPVKMLDKAVVQWE